MTILPTLLALFTIAAPQVDPDRQPVVVVVSFQGQLTEGLVALSIRGIREAGERQAAAVLFEIDTPGGEIGLMNRILTALESNEDLTTVAYVVQQAASAGALIAITCDRLYMKNGSSIGSAMPMIMRAFPIPMSPEGEREQQEVREKLMSHLRSHFRAKAQRTGRSPAIAEAMVDNDLAVYEIDVNGEPRIVTNKEYEELLALHGPGDVRKLRTLCRKDELLNMTAHEAFDAGFIDGIVSSRGEVLEFLDLKGAEVIVLRQSWSEKLVSFTQRFGIIMLALGLLAVFIEVKVPGFGVPGILGTALISLVLLGKYLAGLAEVTEILLIVVGFILIAVEIFVLPGTFVSGLLGALSIMAGLVLSFQSLPLPDVDTPWVAHEWWENAKQISYAFVGGVIGVFLLSHYLPNIPLLNRVVLRTSAGELRGSAAMMDDVHRQWRPAVGALGRTVTQLRPAGKILVEERQLDAVAEGQFLESDLPVQILRIEGNRIVVGPPPGGHPSEFPEAFPPGFPTKGDSDLTDNHA